MAGTAAKAAIAPIDTIMVWAMLGSGMMASIVSHHELLLITPCVAGLIFIAAKYANQRVEDPRLPSTTEFPPQVGAAIERATERIPVGDARRLLADIVREARPLFIARSSAFDASKDNEARAQAAELIIASCDTALELAQLDDMLDVHTAPDGDSPGDMSLLNRLSTARDQFANRLRASSLALGALYASGVEHGTPASDRVEELVADLKADAVARSAAKREIDELLKPGS